MFRQRIGNVEVVSVVISDVGPNIQGVLHSVLLLQAGVHSEPGLADEVQPLLVFKVADTTGISQTRPRIKSIITFSGGIDDKRCYSKIYSFTDNGCKLESNMITERCGHAVSTITYMIYEIYQTIYDKYIYYLGYVRNQLNQYFS